MSGSFVSIHSFVQTILKTRNIISSLFLSTWHSTYLTFHWNNAISAILVHFLSFELKSNSMMSPLIHYSCQSFFQMTSIKTIIYIEFLESIRQKVMWWNISAFLVQTGGFEFYPHYCACQRKEFSGLGIVQSILVDVMLLLGTSLSLHLFSPGNLFVILAKSSTKRTKIAYIASA